MTWSTFQKEFHDSQKQKTIIKSKIETFMNDSMEFSFFLIVSHSFLHSVSFSQLFHFSFFLIFLSITRVLLSLSLPGDLSFGILFIWKLHQIHFVFFFIVLGYQSLFYTSLNSSSLLLISTAGKDFTSHRIISRILQLPSSYFLSFKEFQRLWEMASRILQISSGSTDL